MEPPRPPPNHDLLKRMRENDLEAQPVIIENPVPPPAGRTTGANPLDVQFYESSQSDPMTGRDNKKARTLRSAWHVAQGRELLIALPQLYRRGSADQEVGMQPVMGTDHATRAPLEVIQERVQRQTRGHPLTPSQVTAGVPRGPSMTEDEFFDTSWLTHLRDPHRFRVDAYVYNNQAVWESATQPPEPPQPPERCVLQ